MILARSAAVQIFQNYPWARFYLIGYKFFLIFLARSCYGAMFKREKKKGGGKGKTPKTAHPNTFSLK